jgi:hypothetical protein
MWDRHAGRFGGVVVAAALSFGAAAQAPPTAAPGAAPVFAVVDTGVRDGHPALRGRVISGYNAVHGGADTGDAIGHGTHVAGLLAQGMPQARLLPVRVFVTGAATDAVLAGGVTWAAARTPWLNLSLSATAPLAADAVRSAVAGGALVVVAAGNRGAAHPDWPARFAREPWANGGGTAGAVIAVGAVDDQGRIAAFSNRAGDAARWFLVAPGVDRVSASAVDDGPSVQSGTSMAAPAVTAAAARLVALWPHLTPRQAAEILLASARDLGAPGTDPVYGRGLLDEGRALLPVGDLTVATPRGPVSWSASGLRLSPATVGLAAPARAGSLPGPVGADAYGRAYAAAIAERIGAPLPLRVDRALVAIDARHERVERRLPGGGRMSLAPDGSFALLRGDAGGETAFAAGAGTAEWFGFGAGREVPSLANPYAAFGPTAALAGRGQRWGAWQVRGGVVAGANTEPTGFGWTPVQAGSVVAEVLHERPDGPSFGVTYVAGREDGGWLGAVGSGALAIDDAVQTQSLQLSAALPLGAAGRIAVSYARGRTAAFDAGGLLGAVEAAGTEAWSLAWLRRDTLFAGDTVSLALSQPLRARSGSARWTIPTGMAADGGGWAVGESSLVPAGRERAVEIAWRAPLSRARGLVAAFVWRHEPNHDAGAPAEVLAVVRHHWTF